MPDSTYIEPIYLRGDMVAALTGQPWGTGNPTDPEQTITMPGAEAMGTTNEFYRLVWYTNTNSTDTEFVNGQVWRLEVYNPAADGDGDMTTGSDGWSTVPGYDALTPKNDLVGTGGDPTDGLGAGDEYIVFQDFGGSGTTLLYDINGGLPTTPTDLDYLRSKEQGDTGFGDNDGFLDFYDSYALAPCFVSGTLIATLRGPRPVETLRKGDLVLTADGPPQPIRWAGGRHLDRAAMQENPNLRPIRIRAGALGDNTPDRDLHVSPQHRILVRSRIVQRMFGTPEVLVAAHILTALPGIAQVNSDAPVTYHHLLFRAHEVIFANGAETESLFAGEQALRALGPSARAEIFAIFPQFRTLPNVDSGARPFVTGSRARTLLRRHAVNEVSPITATFADCLEFSA